MAPADYRHISEILDTITGISAACDRSIDLPSPNGIARALRVQRQKSENTFQRPLADWRS